MAHWGKGAITQAVYSPDGKRLGVSTSLGVYIYAAEALQQLDFFPNGGNWPPAAFAPDWSLLALGKGSTVRLLRIADKLEVLHFETQPGHVVRLLFSPDGQYLACLVQPPGEEVYTWNMELRRAADGQLLGTWEAGAMPDVTFSADSQRFYAWNPFRMADMRGWQIPSGTALEIPKEPRQGGLAFSADGQWVAEIEFGSPPTILLKKNGQNEPTRRLVGVDLGQGSMRFTADGALLIVSSYGKPLQVWRTADGTLLKTIGAGNGDRTFLAISPDSQWLVLSAWDGLDFYRLADGKLDKHLGSHFNQMRRVALSPQGNQAAALIQGQGDQSSLVVWHLPDGQMIHQDGMVSAIALAWSPDGEHLALGGWGGKIQILRAKDGKEVLNWPTQTEQVQSVAWSPDGQLLASSSMAAVDIWQARDGALVKRLKVPGGWADSLHFAQKGDRLAGLTGDGNVRVWQVPASPDGDWKELGQFASSNYDNDSIQDFMPDGQSLVITEPAGSTPPSQVWLWRVGEQKPTQHISLLQGVITTLRLSPDGSLLACGLADGTIQLWQMPEGKPLHVLEGGASGIASLDFSGDGQTLISASWDGTVHVWKLR
jgi:WD40 repeat protein